jgi:hypothetical protein
MKGRLSALRTHHTLLPRNIIIFMFVVLISVRGWVNPQGLVRMEGLGTLKKKSSHWESNPQPSGLEHSALTTTPPRMLSFFCPW